MPVISVLAALALLQQPQAEQPRWTLETAPGARYTMLSTSGSVTRPAGASIGVRADSTPPASYGALSTTLPANSFRLRRVRLQTDVEARGAPGGVTAWIRASDANGVIVSDNGPDQPLKGDAKAHREATIFVPAKATTITVGIVLIGRGEAFATAMHLSASQVIDANTPLAPAAQRELDSAIAIAKGQSLWRDTVTWAVVEPDVRAIAAGAESTTEVYPAIRALLAKLGDHHSFLMPPSGAQSFQSGGAENPRATVKRLPENVGYVSVPAYSGAEPTATKAYVAAMYDSLMAVAPSVSCRWVIDLRTNGGGNMWPMLGGLRPFLGNAGLGSFVTAKGNDPLWHADAIDVSVPPSLAHLDSANVAVLTGPRTASSGEAVTISFIGRPHTRLFGLPTAGLSTANQNFTLPDGSMIFLTVSVEADRNGKRYGEKIQPDEVIPSAPANASNDPQLARALAWLASQSCGR